MPTNPQEPIIPPPQPSTVVELLSQVAAERGLDFDPTPVVVRDALPGLTHTVEGLSDRCRDAQERRWLAAALAALSHHVQAGSLAEHAGGDEGVTTCAVDAAASFRDTGRDAKPR